MKKVYSMLLMVCALLLAISFAAGAQEKGRKYTLAVVPQVQPVEVIEKWTPFVKKLEHELGIDIDLLTYTSLTQFEADLAKGVPDFAYMNPYQALISKSAKGGYTPLLRDKSPLVGILVARKGGSVTSLQDVNGKTIAFPAPNSFAASLYLRALLTEHEKIHFNPQYVKTHGNVYRGVAFNTAAAGGGAKVTMMKEPDDIKNHLVVIYETPGTPSHPISAHARISESFRRKMISAILALPGNPAGKELLLKIQFSEPVEADYQKDYLPLKRLGIEKYVGKE